MGIWGFQAEGTRSLKQCTESAGTGGVDETGFFWNLEFGI